MSELVLDMRQNIMQSWTFAYWSMRCICIHTPQDVDNSNNNIIIITLA